MAVKITSPSNIKTVEADDTEIRFETFKNRDFMLFTLWCLD